MNANVLRTVFSSFGIACAVQFFLHEIQSEFVFIFLKTNIINLQVALLAINATTLGIVLTKIREIIDRTGQIDVFCSTKNEMLLSIKEQVALVVMSLLILAIESAKNFPINVPSDVFQSAIIASFIYSILILYDTASSVFVILDY